VVDGIDDLFNVGMRQCCRCTENFNRMFTYIGFPWSRPCITFSSNMVTFVEECRKCREHTFPLN